MPATVSDRAAIEAAYADLDLLGDATDAVRRTIAALDRGELRVAEPVEGEWVVNEWVKQAILLYFRVAGHGDHGGRARSSTTTRSPSSGIWPRPASAWSHRGPCATARSASQA